MRLIDGDALKETLKDLCSASNRVNTRRIEDYMLHDIFPRIIDDEPTIEAEPDNGWISVDDKLPHIERDVLIAVDPGIGGGYIIAIGFYEDGKRFARDSACNWDIDYFDMMYNEDADDWIIPQGWYEGVMFGEEFTNITDKVVYWRPLPEPPKGE